MQDRRGLAHSIIQAIERGEIEDKKALNSFKLQMGRAYGLKQLPTNQDILAFSIHPSQKVLQLLSIKPVRTLSGVAPVAVMTRPGSCPHGKCIMCPGGIGSPFGDVPQSYTGNEPAALRGISNNYDSYLQVFSRLWQYVAAGHNPGKVELIVMGGTFPSTGKGYQDDFVAYALKAMNDFSDLFYPEGKLDFQTFNAFFGGSGEGIPDKREEMRKLRGESTLAGEQARNEKSWVKNVATCIETKPDWCMEKEIGQMLHLGTTRVELGIQCLDNKILQFIHRGHTLEDSVKATRLLKDAALKVMYHVMPGLPLSSREKDIEMFRELFENPAYKPDALKIYPCVVLPGTSLHKLWKQGKYRPLSTEEAAEIIAEAKRYFPRWVRVHRVQRDIPVKFSPAGIDKNNLRQLVEEQLADKGVACKCIRCREAGIKHLKTHSRPEIKNPELFTERYEASGGTEYFISMEDGGQEYLYGFCRLRIPGEPFRKEPGKDAALLRELHVVGQAEGIGFRNTEGLQHRGIGARLLQKAEEIALEEGRKKLSVISGIGARAYYFRKGYHRDGAYVTRELVT